MAEGFISDEMAGAARWLLASGIRTPEGAIARYYRGADGGNMPISTEATGYVASTFAWLFARTGEASQLEGARRTARFLTHAAWNTDRQTFPFEMTPGAPAYFFDCGIIVRGLLAVWRQTRDPSLLETARSCGCTMARDFLAADAIHPAVDLRSGRALAHEPRWSRQPGCYQLKAALAWRELAAVTGEPSFLAHWSRAVDLTVASHGSFLASEPDRHRLMDRLHAYCYFLEGLLAEPGRRECADALTAGIVNTAALLREIAPDFVRSDVYAQLLRLRLLAAGLGAVPLDAIAAGQEAAALARFRYLDPDPRLAGAYSFGEESGRLLPFANPVSTTFCVQALDMWRLHRAGALSPDLEMLI